MKRFSLVIFLVALLGFSIASCSNSPERSAMISPQNENSIRNNGRDTTSNHHNRWSAEGLVTEFPEIFGANVLIFDSLACVDTLLDVLSEAEYPDLRDMYVELGIYNPILESNIVYDSVMKEVAADLCVDLESDTLSDNTLAWFLEQFVHVMVNDYYESCIVGEYVDTHQESCYTVRPIGNIDERALCNEKGIFIADDVVFKYSGNYLLTCPADIYLYLANFDDLEELQEYFDTYGISGVTESDFIIAALEEDNVSDVYQGNSIGTNNYTDDHYRYWYETDQITGEHRADVYIRMYPYWSWFHTHFRCKMTISNYFRGSMIKAKVSCIFHSTAIGWKQGYEPLTIFFLRYMDGLNSIFNIPITSSFKSKTFTQNGDVCFYSSTSNTYVDIYYLYLELFQNSGSDYQITIFKEEEP